MMPWLAFWVAMALSAILTPIGIAMAHRLGVVARPREDRWSTHFRGALGGRPPALMGGVGIYLTLAIGCTGGRHRSVTLVEALRGFLEEMGMQPIVRHRDLDRG